MIRRLASSGQSIDRLIVTTAFLFLIVSGIWQGFVLAAGSGTLAAVVKDSDGPVKGQEVYLYQYDTQRQQYVYVYDHLTDQYGYASFITPPGTFQLEVDYSKSTPTQKQTSTNIQVSDESIVNRTFYFQHAHLNIFVKDSDGPVKGQEVYLYQYDTQRQQYVYVYDHLTDQYGYASFITPPGTFQLEVDYSKSTPTQKQTLSGLQVYDTTVMLKNVGFSTSDIVGPDITIYSIPALATEPHVITNNEQFSISFGSTDPDGVTMMRVLLDGNVSYSYTSGNNETATFGPLSVGQHTIQIQATDSSNHTSSLVVTVNVNPAQSTVSTTTTTTTTTSSTSASSTSTSRTASTSSITSTTATSTKSASTSSTSSTSASIPASHGSYIRTYYSGLFWHPKIAEIHISATDALSSGTLTYVLVVQLLSVSGEAVAQSLPVAGDLFGKVFSAIQEAVGGNPDGSFDFTAMEIARGIGWLYGGSFSEGTIKRVPISFFPIPIPLFNLDTPGYYPLSFTNDQFTGLISSALAVSYNIVNLYDPQGRLYLWVTDELGRQTGFSANASQPFNEIPGSSYVEYNGNMAVILPGNVTRFTYHIDASKATLPTENYTLSISSISDGRITSAKSTQEAILAGQMQSSSVTVTVTETTTASLSSTYPGGPSATNIPTDYVPYLMLSVAIVVASVIIGMAIRRKTAPEGPPSRV